MRSPTNQISIQTLDSVYSSAYPSWTSDTPQCMPDRPSLDSIPISTSSQIITHHGAPVHDLCPLFAELSFFILPPKLDEDMGRIYSIIDELGGTSVSIEEARVVVTALKGRPRLIKALGKEWIVGSLWTRSMQALMDARRMPNRSSTSSLFMIPFRSL